MKKIAIASLILIWCSTCDKEEASPRPYPRVLTGSVTDISSEGARFQGDITFASVKISDHGFIWSKDPAPEFSNSDKLSMGATEGKSHFDAYVNKALAEGIKYYVRAYAKSDDYLVYGDVVSFLSLGSGSPRIDRFSPDVASVGDTIVVVGINFSNKKENNEVRFNDAPSPVIFGNDSVLKVRVPKTLADLSSKISVSIFGNKGTAADSFTLTPLQLFGSDKSAIRICDTLSLTTAHLRNAELDSIIVSFNDQPAMPIGRNGDVLRVKVPYIPTSTTTLSLKLAYGAHQSVLPSSLNFQQPQLQNISPTTAGFLDTLTMATSNFPLCGMSVKVSGIAVTPIEIKSTSFKVIVPANLAQTTIDVQVFVDNNLVAGSSIPRVLRVDSFQPGSGTFDDIVVINGAGFHPDPNQNTVCLNCDYGNFYYFNQPQIISSSSHQMTVKIPRNFYGPENGSANIIVFVANMTVNKDNAFQLKPPVITSIDPATISAGSIITLTGENFNPDITHNALTLDQNSNKALTIISATSTQLMFQVTNDAIAPSNNFVSSDYSTSLTLNVSGQSVTTTPVQVNYSGPWTAKSDFPGANRIWASTFSFNSTLYFGLGKDPVGGSALSDFWKYDPTQNQWTQLSDFPGGARAFAASWVLNGLGYLGFGEGATGSRLKDVWRFDPASDSWTQLADFPGTPLEREYAVVFNNIAYVSAGDFNDFWKVDQNGNWTPLNDLPLNPGGLTASQNSIYASLGNGGTSQGWKLYKYNQGTDSWTTTALDVTVYNRYFTGFGKASIVFPVYYGGLSMLNEGTMQWDQVYSPVPLFDNFYTPFPFFTQNKMFFAGPNHTFYQFDQALYPPN